MLLSIIVPVHNEENNIKQLLNKLILLNLSQINIDKEIIVINDGSTDNSGGIIDGFKNIIKIHQKNLGKGRAVQNGINIAKGEYVIIQDGDLEYDPDDIITMCKKLVNGNSKCIYGSRYLPMKFGFIPRFHHNQNILSYLANILFILMFMVLYKTIITDPLTGYKLYPRKFFDMNQINSNGFEADHEITAKLIKNKYKIEEVPAKYRPRSVAEGKKINFYDAIKAIKTILLYRF